jgi:hypothetical protein
MSPWELIPWAVAIGISMIIILVPVLIYGALWKLIKIL